MIVRTLAQVLAWALLAYIVFVTLGPVADRPQFGYPNLERFFGFAITGACFAIGYSRWWTGIAIGIVITAGVLEAAQNLVPHRDAHVADFAFKAIGGIVGAAIGLLVSWAAKGRRGDV